ncbi:MAG: rod shape-determining protein RodA [bacterium]
MDFGLIFSAAALSLIGILTIFTLGGQSVSGQSNPLFYQQSAWFLMSCVFGYVCWSLNYKLWDRFAWLLYFANIILLIGLLIIGRKVSGAASWFSLGLMRFQPSEFAKILFIVTFAGYLSRYRSELNRLSYLFFAFAQFLLPFGLIIMQPDLGTGLVFVAVFFCMLYVAGVDLITLLISLLLFASGGVAGMAVVMKNYQLRRLTSFLNPENDPLGSGYQLMQSKVAIGSGGLFGKGLFHGTQAKMGFLPASHSDFIFSAFCEQTGLIGALIVLALFIWMLMRIARIGGKAEDLFAVYISAGIFMMLAFQAAQNIGMSVGLFPITGIPLPFVSYGGSSLMTNACAIGLLLNISVRRRKIMFV